MWWDVEHRKHYCYELFFTLILDSMNFPQHWHWGSISKNNEQSWAIIFNVSKHFLLLIIWMFSRNFHGFKAFDHSIFSFNLQPLIMAPAKTTEGCHSPNCSYSLKENFITLRFMFCASCSLLPCSTLYAMLKYGCFIFVIFLQFNALIKLVLIYPPTDPRFTRLNQRTWNHWDSNNKYIK